MFPVGKLPAGALRAVLADVPQRDPRVRIGPQVGEDAAVVDVGDRCIIVATDPVTFATDRIGGYAVHVNANDVAVTGAKPAWFFAVVLLPEQGSTSDLVAAIMSDVRAACDALGITLCGGHTEITAGLPRPIVVGQMIGEVAPQGVRRKKDVRVGDRVLLTRGIAIEGTALLARERRDVLRHTLAADVLDRAARFLLDPGISVVGAALAAAGVGDAVHAMHDPTEGGLVGGLCELVAPAGLGLRVAREAIHVFPETQAICQALGLDPLRLIASGALLIAVAPTGVDAVTAALRAQAISVTDIGEVRPEADGLTMIANGEAERLVPPDRDEIARAME